MYVHVWCLWAHQCVWINSRSCCSVCSGSRAEHHLHWGGGWIKAPSPSQPWLKAAVADMKLKVTVLINCPPPPSLRECSPKIKCLAGRDGALLRPSAVSGRLKYGRTKSRACLPDASTNRKQNQFYIPTREKLGLRCPDFFLIKCIICNIRCCPWCWTVSRTNRRCCGSTWSSCEVT